MATEDLSIAEEWRAIPGHEHYEVSSFGRVRRAIPSHQHPAGFVLKPSPSHDGYLKVSLCLKQKYSYFKIHKLVAMAFMPPQPTPKHEIAHWDGNGHNNRVDNLRWATHKENHQDKKRHGTHNPAKGSSHCYAKLTEASVSEIRRRRSLGEKPSLLAEEFGLSRPSISDILHFRTWKHVT